MNPDLPPPASNVSNGSPPTISYASVSSVPDGIEVGSLDDFSDTLDARGSETITSYRTDPKHRRVTSNDLRSRSWWRKTLKRSLVVILVLLLLAGGIWGLKALVFKTKPAVTVLPKAAPADLPPSTNDLQNPGIITVNRELVVTGEAKFQQNISVQGNATLQKDLRVEGNGSVGGNLNISGNGSVQGNLNVVGDGNFTGTITAANFRGDGSQLTNIVASCTNCVHLQSKSPGTTETGSVSISGVLDAGSLQGSGVGITSINASNLASGTLADARLSTNVALLGANNNFSGGVNSFSGNVGIGTVSPLTALEIRGDHVSGIGLGLFKGNSNIGYISVDTSTTINAFSGYLFKHDGVKLGEIGLNSNDNNLYFYNFYGSNSPLLTLSGTNKVGIGTTTPAAKLDVAGSILQNGNMVCDASNNCGYTGGGAAAFVQGGNSFGALAVLGTNDNQALAVQTNGAEALRVDNTGRIGIGTSTPNTLLQVVGPHVSTIGVAQFKGSGAAGYISTDTTSGVLANSGLILKVAGVKIGEVSTDGSNVQLYNILYDPNNAVVTLASNGNVGIGTASPQQALHVNNDFIFGTASAPSNTFSQSAAIKGLFYNDQDPGGFGYTSIQLGAKEFGGYAGSDITYGYGSTADVWTNLFSAGAELNDTSDISTRDYNIYDLVTHKNKLGISGSGDIAFGTMNNPNSFTDASVIIKSNGNLGIGITSPTAQLQVQGSTQTSGAITMTGSTGANTFTTSASITLNVGDYIIPTTSTAQKMVVTVGGTGTTFTVNPALTSNIAAETFTVYKPITNITTSTGSSALLVQGSTGNVGIGTNTPQTKLSVVSANSSTTFASQGFMEIDNTDVTANNTFGLAFRQNDAASLLQTVANIDAIGISHTSGAQSGALAFGTRNAGVYGERLRIDSNGNVGIGTTAPASTLDVYANTHAAIRVTGSGDGANFSSLNLSSDEATDKSWVIAHRQFAGETNKLITYYFNGATYNPTTTIDPSGNFGIGTTTPQDLLDVNGGLRVATLNATAGATAVCRNASNQLSVCAGSGSGPSLTLQDTYNNSASPATITTTGAAKTVLLKAGAGFDSTSLFQVQNAAGNPVLTVDTANSLLAVRGINSNASLGSELISNTDYTTAGWTSTGWTTTATTATHTPGNTNAFSTNQVSVVAGKVYQVTFTVTGSPAAEETIRPVIGGSINGSLIRGDAASQVQLLYATTTGDLQFIPSSNWSGTISAVSVKLVTLSNSAINVLDDTGSIALEVRAPTQAFGGRSTFIGLDAGRSNTTGYYNTGIGNGALANNTTGGSNIALGGGSLGSNTTGDSNTAVGIVALANNTSGTFNTALGMNSLSSNTNGIYNTAAGAFALQSTTGDANTGFGLSTLYANTIGTGNVAVGFGAGAQSTTGNNNVSLGYNTGATTVAANANITGSNNTYVGYNAGPGTPTQLQNATAIGTNAVVSQSDSLVLGCVTGVNGCANGTSVGIGTASPAKARLSVVDSQTAANNAITNDDISYTQRIQGTVTDGSALAINNEYRGLYVEAKSTASNLLNVLNGQNVDTINKQSSGTINLQDGINSGIWLEGAGNTTTSGNFRAFAILSSSGSLANYNGLDVTTPLITSTGTIGITHAVNIEPQKISGVGTAYGIYQAGVDDLNYFAGSVGIGTVTPLKSRLNVVDTQTAIVSVPSNDDANYAQRIQGTVTDGYASPINNQYRGLDIEVTSTAGNYLNVLNSQAVITYNKQSGGTIGFQDGVNSDTRLDGAGNTTFGSGFRAIPILSSSGNLSSYNGLDVRTPVITSTGTIGTIHAVNIDPQTISGVGSAYGIYQSGANDLNYFGGNVGIGTATPTASLQTQGAAGTSSGLTTMTASNGVTTFTTSTSITLNVGDYIVPTTSTGQARAVTIGGTGTSFTIFYPFTANVTGETFTIYRPTANFTNNAGVSTLFVQGSTGSVGIGTTTPDAPLKVQFSDNFYARGLAIRNTNTGTNAVVGVSLQDSNGVGKANFDYLSTSYGATNLQDTAAITSVGSSTRLAFISGADQPSLGGGDIFFQSGVSNPNLIIKGATGNVGIGTATPNSKLHVLADSNQSSGSFTGINLTGSQTVASSGIYYGVIAQPAYTNSGTLDSMIGISAAPNNSGTGTINNLWGSLGQIRNNSTGTLINAIGTLGVVSNITNGTVNNAYGLYGRVDNLQVAGTVTNGYGLYLEDNTGAGSITNKYGVYQVAANATNYFGGNVGIGTTSPTLANLQISSTAPDVNAGSLLTVNGLLTSTTNQQYGIYSNPTIAPSSSSTQFVGINSTPTTSAVLTGGITGVTGYPMVTGTGSVPGISGAYFGGELQNTATVGTGTGIYVDATYKSIGATLTNSQGIYVEGRSQGATSNAGVIINESSGGNNSNLVIGQKTVPSGSYSIYNSSTDQNYFAGKVGIGIGASTPVAKLHVAGSNGGTDQLVYSGPDKSLFDPSYASSYINTSPNTFSVLNSGGSKNYALEGIAQDNTTIGIVATAGTIFDTHTSGTKAFSIGVDGDAYNIASGTTNILAGVSGFAGTDGSATSSIMASLFGWSNYRAGTSTVPLNAGLYLQDQTGSGATTDYQIYSAGASPFVVRSDGNVGIGTAGPGSALQIGNTVSMPAWPSPYDTLNSAFSVNQTQTGFANQSYISSNYVFAVSPTNNQPTTGGRIGAGTENLAINSVAYVPITNDKTIGKVLGVAGSAENYGSGSINELVATGSWVKNSGTGTITDSSALWAGGANYSTGTTTNLYGLNVAYLDVGDGTVTNMYGAHIDLSHSAGELTNRYGLYLTSSGTTSSNNDFGIYEATTQKNYFAGNVGIGTPTPGNLLSLGALTTADASGQLAVSTGGVNNKGMIIQAVAGQNADLLQAQDSTGAVLASIDKVGNLTVKNTTINGTLSVSGHIITANASGTTTIAAGAAACTTPTVTLSGNDTSGTITVITGSGCSSGGVLATISFATTYSTAPRVVVSADNANAAALQYYTSNRTTTTFDLATNTPPIDATTHTYNYQVVQ